MHKDTIKIAKMLFLSIITLNNGLLFPFYVNFKESQKKNFKTQLQIF